MRITPVLSVLLAVALSQPVLAASGEREAQAGPHGAASGASAPTAGGGAAQGPTLPTGNDQPPASTTVPRGGGQPSSASGQAQPPAGPAAQGQGGGNTMQGGSAQGGEKPASQYAPDNTGRNRDHDRRMEAEDQSNSAADVEVVARIRRALTDDASLSLHAHNVKIIVQGGRVTLRGPVKGEAEKRKVESIVRRAAGTRQVVNELEATGR